jgi:hypothetical protein
MNKNNGNEYISKDMNDWKLFKSLCKEISIKEYIVIILFAIAFFPLLSIVILLLN